MSSKRVVVSVSVLLIWCVLATSVSCRAQDDRIGFAEEFDTLEGWEFVDEKNPLEGMHVENGVAVFDTWVGSFMGAKPESQPLVVRATSDVVKEYPEPVDLDKYHYIVMKTDAKSMFSLLYLNDKQIQASYTTGVIAQDLKPLGLGGMQQIKLQIEIMNNNREMKVDYIRLVSRLTDLERKNLIYPPVGLYKEDIETHPYQKLEALYERAARPMRPIAEEKIAFRDVGTRAQMWRMSGIPTDEGFSERYEMWRPDGSAFQTLTGGNRTYFFDRDEFVRNGFKTLFPPQYDIGFYTRRGWVQFRRYDTEKKNWEVLYEEELKGAGRKSDIHGDRLVALANDSLIVVNADETDEAKRVKRFPVPSANAKGGSLTPDGKWFCYYSPFGVYRKYCINTENGEVREGCQFTFTHGMGGYPWSIMSYGTLAKLQVHADASYPGNDQPDDKLKVHSVYLDPVRTDYGAMTLDGRYGYTNGIGGELAAQYVLFDRSDPGTILRLCTYHVSKVEWYIWTKSIASPDYTKMMFVSDMLGNSDYYMSIVRLPDAPRNLKAVPAQNGVRLSWDVPERHAEIKGYNVYRASESGRNCRRVNTDLVQGTAFVDTRAPAGPAFYMVAAEEHSGLEGYFSKEMGVNADGRPLLLHFEAEEHENRWPMRMMFDGDASGYHAMRVTPVAEVEKEGSLAVATGLPRAGDFWVWARCRTCRTGPAVLKVNSADGGELAQLDVASSEWTWVRTKARVPLEKDASLTFVSASDGLAVDRIILTDIDGYVPREPGDRKAPPPAPDGLEVTKVDPQTVELAWQAVAAPDVSYYSVYVGEKPDFVLGNETVLCSGRKTSAVDWGLEPGTTYYYKVVAVDKRGGMSQPAAVEASTAPLEVVVRELEATQGQATPGLKKARAIDVDYVEFPQGAPAEEQKLDLEFDVPADGDYYLWCEYSPRHTKGQQLLLHLDGQELGRWVTHQPWRLRRNREIKAGTERWFVERVVAGKGRGRDRPSDKTTLEAGKHTLTVVFAGDKAGQTPWVSKFWFTNDASFKPSGHSPQFRFNRRRRQN